MLKPIDKVAMNNFGYLKDYLTSPEQSTPNDQVSIMNACVGLIDAILSGRLVICAEEPELPEPLAEQPPEDPDKIDEMTES